LAKPAAEKAILDVRDEMVRLDQTYLSVPAKVLPSVRPGGLILAHNADMVPDYVKAITANPDLQTLFYVEGSGLAVTLKKR
jgi:predicted O-methyltransferase YrrM